MPVQSKINNTHQFRVRDQKNILKLINIFNDNIITEHKNKQFNLRLQTFNEKYSSDIKYINSAYKVNLDYYQVLLIVNVALLVILT